MLSVVVPIRASRSAPSPSIRDSHRPFSVRMPMASTGTPLPRTASPRPIASRQRSPLDSSVIPAPISPNLAARSRTVTRQPTCRSATAAVSPPIPPPTTTADLPSISALLLTMTSTLASGCRRGGVTTAGCRRSPPLTWSHVGARHPPLGRPGSELLGVAYRPDVGDPAGGHSEREHRGGRAASLNHQAGLPVDRAFQDRHVGYLAGDAEGVPRQLLAAFDRAERSGDHTTAVGGHHGVRVKQPDEGVDVLGLPCLLEIPDD